MEELRRQEQAVCGKIREAKADYQAALAENGGIYRLDPVLDRLDDCLQAKAAILSDAETLREAREP